MGPRLAAKRPPLPNKFTSKFGLLSNLTNNSSKFNNHNNSSSGPSLDLLTNEIFGSLMMDKSDQLLAHNFDELGILDLERKSPQVRSATAVVYNCVAIVEDSLLYFTASNTSSLASVLSLPSVQIMPSAVLAKHAFVASQNYGFYCNFSLFDYF